MKLYDEFVSNLEQFETFMEGVFMANAAAKATHSHPSEGIELIPGAEKGHVFEALPEWIFRCLTAEQQAKDKVKLPYLVYCTKANARVLRAKLFYPDPETSMGDQAGDQDSTKLSERPPRPAFLPKIKIPEFPRYHFATLREAYDKAESMSPAILPTVKGTIIIPAEVQAYLNRVAAFICTTPEVLEIDGIEALQDKIKEKKTRLITCAKLADIFGRVTMHPDFDIDSNRGHLQFPDNWNRQKARVLIEFALYFGNRRAKDLEPLDAPDFVSHLVGNRKAKKGGGKIQRNTLKKHTGSICEMFSFAVDMRYADINPFGYLESTIKNNAAKPLGIVRKGHDCEELIRLFRYTWEHNKLFTLVVATIVYVGTRRGELLGLKNRNFDFKHKAVDVPDYAEKKSKEVQTGRSVDMDIVGEEWFRLFPFTNPEYPVIPLLLHHYDKWLRVMREAVGLPEWGKDGLRKDFSISKQWEGLSMEEQQEMLGHVLGSATTKTSYHGAGSRAWAMEKKGLTPLVVLGFQPKPLTEAEFQACVQACLPTKKIKLKKA